MFEAAGGEVVRIAPVEDARAWLREFCSPFGSAAVGETVPAELRPEVATAPPHEAELGVSMASGAVAETGSLALDARDGRRTQLLPPTHLVWVRASMVQASMAGAFATSRDDLPSAMGLHSGPSKSADIGQILVTGVHGPGRVIAAILGEE
jgi:L-lactate dehydrogenase complex protein LldG